MSESKLKYLKLLKSQYHSGQITKRQYKRELRWTRNQKTWLQLILEKLSFSF